MCNFFSGHTSYRYIKSMRKKLFFVLREIILNAKDIKDFLKYLPEHYMIYEYERKYISKYFEEDKLIQEIHNLILNYTNDTIKKYFRDVGPKYLETFEEIHYKYEVDKNTDLRNGDTEEDLKIQEIKTKIIHASEDITILKVRYIDYEDYEYWVDGAWAPSNTNEYMKDVHTYFAVIPDEDRYRIHLVKYTKTYGCDIHVYIKHYIYESYYPKEIIRKILKILEKQK